MSEIQKGKRSKDDFCNICGKKDFLTVDHVPPKACNNSDIRRITTIFNPKGKPQQKESQNGLNYRSICRYCNNTRLGRNYDPVYEQFVQRVTSELEKLRNGEKRTFTVNIKINKLLRGIVGHLLAAKAFYDGNCKVDEDLRKYFLDEDMAFPIGNYHLYYYVYPYESINVVRDVVPGRIVRSYCDAPDGMISCLAACPIAYILNDSDKRYPLNDLFAFGTKNIEEAVEIPVDILSAYYPMTNKLRNPMWPINMGDKEDDMSFILVGESGSSAAFAEKKRKNEKL